MFAPYIVVLTVLLYMGLLFLVAQWVERQGSRARKWAGSPFVYAISLAVYCSSWTFYGSVGKAASTGLLFLSIYLGPTLAILLWWTVLRKLVRIKNAYRITSIADLISARYDKSGALAALATVLAVLGTMPYIALQLKSVFSTFAIIVTPGSMEGGWIGRQLGPLMVVLMIVFTLVFGVRRLAPGERHQGMVMALVVECLVKLLTFLAVGVFVTYHLHDGFGDIFRQLADSPYRNLLSFRGHSSTPYVTWTSYLVLAMSAIIFLPRQFHIAVVENSDERHIRTAMWLFPLYMLLICLFAFPIAAGGLLMGLAAPQADTFVLQLPLAHGNPWLAMSTFIGGFSAATGMVMICSMTLAVMISNHLLLPLVGRLERLSFLRRYLLECRWVAVVAVLLLSYGFERQAGDSYTLVNIGMISFAAAFQFAPPILGGIFWRRGNKVGALLGLGAGFLIWFYTSLLPSFVKSGWLPVTILHDGPWGIGWLNPEQLFGLTGFDPISHTVFWSFLGNAGLYVLGSLCFRQSREEQNLAESFVGALAAASRPSRPMPGEARIPLAEKREKIERVLIQFYPRAQAAAIGDECVRKRGIEGKQLIAVEELVDLHQGVEKHLAGAIGAASAREAMKQGKILTPEEAKGLSEIYAEILAELSVTPDELRRKIDYYQEKEVLLQAHARELEERIFERDEQIAERRRAEEALRQAQEELIRKEKLATLGQLAGSVGHELRNPLGVMNNAVYFLKMVMNDADATIREYLEIIKKEIDNSQRIITDLLDFARTRKPQTRLVAARELIDDTTGRCTFPEHVTVRVDLPDTLPALSIDPLQMTQVLQNIVTNGVQAMPDGGTLTIKAEEEVGGGALRIKIADTGEGISPEGMKKLFQPLYTTKAKGIGLGLVVCRNLVEANGGRIEVDSAVGKGSCFSVVLPVHGR